MIPDDHGPIHLDGRHYDLITAGFVEDIPFYLRQFKKYGEPVLELACGTGRITIPLAEEGAQITGLDVTDSMLSYAKKKAAERGVRGEWIKADCRNFQLKKTFNLILFPFNSIAVLHDRQSLEACLGCVRAHLKKTGRFIIDFFNPSLDLLTRDPSQRYPVVKYAHPEGKGEVVVTENNVYDAASQINRVKFYYKMPDRAEEAVDELNLRMFYPQELDALLGYNGFTIEAKYGNYDESPFDSSSPKQLLVCTTR